MRFIPKGHEICLPLHTTEVGTHCHKFIEPKKVTKKENVGVKQDAEKRTCVLRKYIITW